VRILVVEDDPTVSVALTRGLQAEGFDVDVAGDGDTGFWMATETEYSALLLDVMLPERNGFQLCSDLRTEGVETPILMLTAKSGEYDEAEGLDAGADDYLTKPFSFVVLSARIRAMLRRPGQRREAVQRIGDLAIDSDRRTCSTNGVDVSLTHREFALLEVLARQPGAVCSKDFLLEQVWGPDFNGSRNIVEVYIGYLRRKLASSSSSSPSASASPSTSASTSTSTSTSTSATEQRIRTVHGHGYRLES